MVVRRIIEGIPRPFLTSPVDKLKEFHHDGLYQGGGAMTVLVAAGPYTTTDSLEYEPLEDLLKVRKGCLGFLPSLLPFFLTYCYCLSGSTRPSIHTRCSSSSSFLQSFSSSLPPSLPPSLPL